MLSVRDADSRRHGRLVFAGFRRVSEHIFPKGLPDFVPGRPAIETALRGAVFFDRDWSGQFVRLDTRDPTDPWLVPNARTYATYRLRQVYQQLSVKWPVRQLGIPGWRPVLALTDRQGTALIYTLAMIILTLFFR